jgi:hypothetical protein
MNRTSGIIGTTIGVLMTVVAAVVLVALVATGHAGDRGGLVFLGGLLVAGGYVVGSSLRTMRRPDAPVEVEVPDPSGLYGPTTTTLPAPAAPRSRAWVLVLGVVGLLVVGSLAIAVVASVADDHLHGPADVVALVVSLLALLVVAGVGWYVRRLIALSGPRRPRR